MPLIAFILLAIVCLALVGFVCACLGDEVALAVERATTLGSTLPPLVVVWTYLVALAATGLAIARWVPAVGRASPQSTQRFLF